MTNDAPLDAAAHSNRRVMAAGAGQLDRNSLTSPLYHSEPSLLPI